MPFKLFTITLIAVALLSACAMETVNIQKLNPDPVPAPADAQSAVIVELFTSEGCSSCPSAERNLEFLAREQPVPSAEIIPLELHVDYWDRLGWKDPFSSAQFSARQEYYGKRFKLDSVYTPQIVIDGSYETSGNSGTVTRLISEAAKSKRAIITVIRSDDVLNIDSHDLPEHQEASVFVAISEDGLAREVKGGENSGRTLGHNSVVRRLTAISSIPPGKSGFAGKYPLELDPGWDRASLDCVVFFQENTSRRIFGAVKVEIK